MKPETNMAPSPVPAWHLLRPGEGSTEAGGQLSGWGAPPWPEWSGPEGQRGLWVLWARRHAGLAFLMIYTVTITHRNAIFRQKFFLITGMRTKGRKALNMAAPLAAPWAHPTVGFRFFLLQTQLIQHKEPPVREGCSISVILSR